MIRDAFFIIMVLCQLYLKLVVPEVPVVQGGEGEGAGGVVNKLSGGGGGAEKSSNSTGCLKLREDLKIFLLGGSWDPEGHHGAFCKHC